MNAPKTQIIGNNTYEFLPLPCMRGVAVLTRLVQMLGPSFGELIAGLPKTKGKIALTSILDVDAKVLAKAVTVFSGILKDDDLKFLVEQMFGPYVKVHKGEGRVQDLNLENLNLHFAGNVGEMLKVLVFAIKENFGDFLGDAANFQSAAQ